MTTPRTLLSLFCSLVIVMGVACQSSAGDTATLKLGDPAPALVPTGWLNGAPVAAFAPGTIYVVECWATWCGPCKAAIPHLSAMNTRVKDQHVVVIGLNVYEKDLSLVAPFVTSMGDKMNYRVALDKDGANAAAWLEAAGQSGIPCSFVVDKAGKLAWFGHPMAGLDEVVDELVAGTFNLATFQAKQEERQAQLKDLGRRFEASLASHDLPTIQTAIAAIVAVEPAIESGVYAQAFDQLFAHDRAFAVAYALADQGLAKHLDMNAQNAIAWTILDTKDVPAADRKLPLALSLARQADALAGHKDAAVLDTLALAYFLTGDQKQAIETEQQAISLAPADEKADLTKSLNRFKAGPVVP
jgi:thiol-disulfide isomerase/thioredoxin